MPDNKKAKPANKIEKPFWKQDFNRIPEVLSISDIAEYLRVSETTVNGLISNGDIQTLPGLDEKRVFKGFSVLLNSITPRSNGPNGQTGGCYSCWY